MDRIVIETEWLPPIVMVRPLDSGPPSAVTRFLKPRVRIYTPYATEPLTIAPVGAPMNNWPYLRIILGLTALLAAVTVVDFARGRYGKQRGLK